MHGEKSYTIMYGEHMGGKIAEGLTKAIAATTPRENISCYKELVDLYEGIYTHRNFSSRLTEYINAIGYEEKRKTINEKVTFLSNKIDDMIKRPATMSEVEYEKIKTFWRENKSNGFKLATSSRQLQNYFSQDNLEGDLSGISHVKNTRNTIFLLCFVFELDYEQSREFFEKVYLDRFISRRPEEIIFHHCLLRKLPYIEALRLLMNLEVSRKQQADDKQPSSVQATSVYFDSLNDDDIDDSKILDMAIAVTESSKIYEAVQKNVEQELTTFITHHMQGRKDPTEIFLRLTGSMLDCQQDASSYCGIHKILLNEMPRVEWFSQNRIGKSSNFQSLRNQLVLLHFYNYWGRLDGDTSVAEYYSQIFDMLENQSLNGLYECNPYDALFIMSVKTQRYDGQEIAEKTIFTENPIDVFHSILHILFPEQSPDA